MERVKVEVVARETGGKESGKKMRRAGKIPAIVYGKDVNIPITVSTDVLKTLKAIHFSESTILDMEIANGKKKKLPVIIKNIQYHPLTEEIIHLDFLKVSLKEKIKIHVPLVLKGEAKGVKEEGVLEVIHREIEVEGFPLDIPEKVEIDISALEIGDSLHVKDIDIAGNIKVITPPDETIVTVGGKEEEIVEEVTPEEEEEVPEGPEVIKEKKEGEEEAPAEEGKPEKKEDKENKEKKEK